MLPPTVPRFRIATWPINGAASASNGQACRIARVLLENTLSDEGSEPQARRPPSSMPIQPGHAVDVDEHGRRRQPQVQQGPEALAAREHLRVVAEAGEEVAGLVDRLRRVVVEARRLQPSVPIASTASSWKGSTLSFPTSRIRSIES